MWSQVLKGFKLETPHNHLNLIISHADGNCSHILELQYQSTLLSSDMPALLSSPLADVPSPPADMSVPPSSALAIKNREEEEEVEEEEEEQEEEEEEE